MKNLFYIILLLVIIVYIVPNLQDNNQINTIKETTNESVTKRVEIKNNNNKKILKIVKNKEPKVKDAIFDDLSGDILYIGLYNDGSSRKGFADYLCTKIKTEYKLQNRIMIKIVDYSRLLRNQEFIGMGQVFCTP